MGMLECNQLLFNEVVRVNARAMREDTGLSPVLARMVMRSMDVTIAQVEHEDLWRQVEERTDVFIQEFRVGFLGFSSLLYYHLTHSWFRSGAELMEHACFAVSTVDGVFFAYTPAGLWVCPSLLDGDDTAAQAFLQGYSWRQWRQESAS